MLKRKMLRDIRLNLSQFVTIFLMVCIGVLAYSGIEAYMAGMEETADNFYSDYNLQDLNVMGTNFDESDLDKILKLDGVYDANLKLSVTGSSDDDKTLLLNFIESNSVSKFYVVDGCEFDYDKSGVWLDEFYASANDINVGDKINIKYDGYSFQENVVGIINVPDHIYDVKDASELYPDHKEFGFAYLSTKELEGYIKNSVSVSQGIDENTLEKMNFDYRNYLVFNYIMVDVLDNFNVSDVKEDIENNIDNYLIVSNIEDTTSYSTYQGEIDEGKTYVGVFSGLFIFIAMLSVITTMSRVVKNQRIQIGTLKALGFKDFKIIMHYISYGAWISLVASICGLVIGYYGVGKLFINLEMSFFEIPNGHPVMVFKSYICALLVVVCVCLVTVFVTINNLRKSPAETLRVSSPKVNVKALSITTKGIFKKLNFSSVWNIRDILRNKIRTITGVIGIAGSTMLIVCAFGMLDSLNHFVTLQFDDLYNFNYKLSLNDKIDEDSLNELMDKYGDNTSLSYLVEIYDKNGNKSDNNIFVTDASEYVRFVDDKGDFIKLDNNNGVYITYKLADTLGYKKGDTIKWSMAGSNKYYESEIVGFNKDPQNQNMTMTREYYESLGNSYKPDSLYTNVDLSNTSEIKDVLLIQDIDALKNGMTNMLSVMRSMIVLIIFIAILLGSVIIYNMGVLSFSEREYQFATLKVLGFQDKKIKKIFVKQNIMITVVAIIIGIPCGYYLTDYLFKVAIEDSYDFEAHILLWTYIYAAVGTYLISYLVSKFLSSKIPKIDMVSSLKGNE